jgi:hypothetical protein
MMTQATTTTMTMMTKMTMPIRLVMYILMMSHHKTKRRQKIKECTDQDKRTEERQTNMPATHY